MPYLRHMQPIVAASQTKIGRATGAESISWIRMNIEIANRLVNLRKKNGLSQEALAEKLGISRQAVSKWERAEASPDTDNIILLARLYGVSLDELLQTEDEIPASYSEEKGTEAEAGSQRRGEPWKRRNG